MVGYGRSMDQGHDRDLSVSRQAEYLNQWLDAQDLSSVIVVGHDLGGGVAQNLAVRHPLKVAGLVLTNCIAYDNWPIPRVRALQLAAPLAKRFPDAVTARMIRNLMSRGHDDPTIAADSFEAHWANYAAYDGAAAFVRQTSFFRTRDTEWLADRLPDLRIPARIVWGAADPFLKLAYGQRLARDLNAPLDTIAGGKHFVPEDHPDRVADAVLSVADEIGRSFRAPAHSLWEPDPSQP